MDKDFLIGLGVDEAVVEKIVTAHTEATQTAVATITQERDSLATQITERDTELEALKNSSDNEELKAQIATLQADLKAKDAEAATTLSQTKLDYELQIALQKAGALNVKAADALLDKSVIKFGEDGKVEGLSEQLETIKADNAFLFQSAESTPNFTAGGNPPVQTSGNDGSEALAEIFAK
jgi:hypothetical protein